LNEYEEIKTETIQTINTSMRRRRQRRRRLKGGAQEKIEKTFARRKKNTEVAGENNDDCIGIGFWFKGRKGKPSHSKG
jgi:hypothetical protein